MIADTRTSPPKDRAGADDLVDEASAASMDSSDPPAYSGVTGVGAPADVADRIRRRAFDLWVEAGRPAGRDVEFREQAEREMRERGS